MAKITQEQRSIYQQKIKHYKANIEELKKQINNTKIEMLKNQNISAVLSFKAANIVLNLITIYCAMNEISVYLLDVRNTAFLEKARQQVYEAIIFIEKVVSNYLNVPFSEYAEKLDALKTVTDIEKLNFIKKLGYCIDLIKENFGENTKWKWSFVEIDGRFAIISKNLFDLKKFQRLDDPRSEGFYERKSHFSIIQKKLFDASLGYREKFELITKDIEDLKRGIDFQSALLRLNQLIGDVDKIENCKKHIDVWSNILEKHLSMVEEEKRRKKAQQSK